MKAVVNTNILIRSMSKPRGTVGPILTRLRNGDKDLLTLKEFGSVRFITPRTFLAAF